MQRWLAGAAAIALTCGPWCGAAEYSFALPELTAGPPKGSWNLDVALGGAFTSIHQARLRLAGWYEPGLLGDLNSPQLIPYPAAIDAYSAETHFNRSANLGLSLSSVAGPFEVDLAFHGIGAGGSPSYASWLDGSANLDIRAAGAFYAAIYYEIERPVVTFSSATLVVSGERIGAAATPTADFSGNRVVDAPDLTEWVLAFAGSAGVWADSDNDLDADGADFLAWQRELGLRSSAASSAAAPEPQSLVAATWLAVAAWSVGRRRRCVRD